MYQELDIERTDINAEPPIEEPARQYYYIGKCRQYVKKFLDEKGRSPSACVTTFGCQVNTVHEIGKAA